jgi:hypothetical protein
VRSGPEHAFRAEEKGTSVVIRQVGEAKKGGGLAGKKTLRFGRQTDWTQSSTLGER